jgi:hypothetical protein
MRAAVLKVVINNESGLQGPDTYTRIRFFKDDEIIHELLEKRSYELAEKISRHWVSEGVLPAQP